MLLKSFFLLFSLGQAAQVLRASIPHIATSSDSTIQSTPVNGTLTSFSILEGSGCPAGTYHAQPIEPGKSLNTYVDFDAGVFLFNSTTSTAPVTCTLSINFEFIYPEDGLPEVFFGTVTNNEAKFEEGDVDRGTNFIEQYDVIATAGDEGLDGSLKMTRIIDDGPRENQVGVLLYPVGTPGEVNVGTFQAKFSISTDFGPGEFSVSRIAVGFGLYELLS
ncbi:hypothetical protein K505DRAFT_365381 [Melanomma pulvis-pyrius CBS 109.77]|uniref:Ubiquitin 3 binding protein But2 C-terminal domain-containing protein n=1 Tax=Melanomma pulvis-pyrius CBS 109.77 TaxID=1314802 RepID=A0A6A6X0K7_9PLEO|nr:hypothetical protein K505DRAFT_365381 [Melanomma pulvis-pyrius CBS 109.77]